MAAGKAPQPTQQLHSHVNDIIWRAMKRSQIPPVKAPVGLLRQDGRKIPRSSDMQAVMNHYTKFLCHSYSLLHLVMITIGWLWWIFADRTNSIVVAKVTVQHSQLFAATFENQLKCCSSLRVCVCVCVCVKMWTLQVRLTAFQSLGAFISTFADSSATGLHLTESGVVVYKPLSVEEQSPVNHVTLQNLTWVACCQSYGLSAVDQQLTHLSAFAFNCFFKFGSRFCVWFFGMGVLRKFFSALDH